MTPETGLTFTSVNPPSFGCSIGQLVLNYADLPEKFDPSCSAIHGHSRSLELTQITAIRDLLLVFYSNHVHISYGFRVWYRMV